MTAKILTLDIETYPSLGYYWSRFKPFIHQDQEVQPGRVAAVGAKWLGSKNAMWFSEFHCEGGHEQMIRSVHSIVNEADIIVHYNGKRFDMPWLRTEMAKYGLTPPAPAKEVDLYQVVKRQFRLPSNRLDDALESFELPRKMKHSGFPLWKKCMEGDAKAWAEMRRYCVQDVRSTEMLYLKLRGWIPNHPHLGLYLVDDGEPTCGNCGGKALQRRGLSVSSLGSYQRWQCQNPECGKWSRSKKSEVPLLDVRPIA